MEYGYTGGLFSQYLLNLSIFSDLKKIINASLKKVMIMSVLTINSHGSLCQNTIKLVGNCKKIFLETN